MYFKRNFFCILILVIMQIIYTVFTCKFIESYGLNYCSADVILENFHPFYFGFFVMFLLAYNIFSETKDDMLPNRVILRKNKKNVMLHQLKQILLMTLIYSLLMITIAYLTSLIFTDTAINWNDVDSYFAHTRFAVLNAGFAEIFLTALVLIWARCVIISIGMLLPVWLDIPRWIPFLAILLLGVLECVFSSVKIFQRILTPNLRLITRMGTKVTTAIYVAIVLTVMLGILIWIVRKKEFYAKEN